MQSAHHMIDVVCGALTHHPRYKEEQWLHSNQWHTCAGNCGTQYLLCS